MLTNPETFGCKHVRVGCVGSFGHKLATAVSRAVRITKREGLLFYVTSN